MFEGPGSPLTFKASTVSNDKLFGEHGRIVPVDLKRRREYNGLIQGQFSWRKLSAQRNKRWRVPCKQVHSAMVAIVSCKRIL